MGTTMNSTPDLAQAASLIGDSSRAAILLSLLSGRTLPASELARAAKITPPTASAHLAKMVEGGLLVSESSGRHRYYRLASPEVAQALEALNSIASPKPIRSLRESEQSKALRFARTCYDHLAGEVGVALTDRLLELEFIQVHGCDYVLKPTGSQYLTEFGVDVNGVVAKRRKFARQCLDWSERRHHLAGALGSAITQRLFDLGWITRVDGIRAVHVTTTGRVGFGDVFGLKLESRAH